MKKFMLAGIIVASSFMYMGVAYAKGSTDMKNLLSDLTNKSVEEIETLSLDKTLGEIATESGVYDQFMASKKQLKIKHVNEKVESGIITQEEANSLIEKINAKTGCDNVKLNMNLKNRSN